MDDEFMTKCFEDNVECTELVLRIIMDKDDLIVKSARTQYTLKNLQGRSVRLDIFADDSFNRKYNIEVQKSKKGAGFKRARYNSSLMDANAILPGDDVELLPENYVIFITESDLFGMGLPVYHIDRVVEEIGVPFGDEHSGYMHLSDANFVIVISVKNIGQKEWISIRTGNKFDDRTGIRMKEIDAKITERINNIRQNRILEGSMGERGSGIYTIARIIKYNFGVEVDFSCEVKAGEFILEIDFPIENMVKK